MAYVNFQRSYIRFKIVYYGPGLCGKTTNLEYLHKLSKGTVEMISLETEGDRTIFFDYMPLNLGKLGGIETVFKLYTVPGQVKYNKTRQMVLRDVDGVVFVADSQAEAMPANLESLNNLAENLSRDGVDPDHLPAIIQYNKRDLPNALPVAELERQLNTRKWPSVAASALAGDGVKETLTRIAQLVFADAAARYGLAPKKDAPAKKKSEDDWSGLADEAIVESRTASIHPPRDRDSWPGLLDEVPSPDEMAELHPQMVRTVAPASPIAGGEGTTAEFESKLWDALQKMMGISEKVRDAVERVREDVVRLDASIEGLRDGIHREIRSQVDQYLASYLKEIEDGLAPMPSGKAKGCEDHPKRTTAAPPKKRNSSPPKRGRSGRYVIGGTDESTD
jgi:mutual gliding-motility protein MglA